MGNGFIVLYRKIILFIILEILELFWGLLVSIVYNFFNLEKKEIFLNFYFEVVWEKL